MVVWVKMRPYGLVCLHARSPGDELIEELGVVLLGEVPSRPISVSVSPSLLFMDEDAKLSATSQPHDCRHHGAPPHDNHIF